MPRLERVSNIQALAWLNAIAEDDPGDESKSENICESLDQRSANSDQLSSTYMGSDFFRWIGFRY